MAEEKPKARVIIRKNKPETNGSASNGNGASTSTKPTSSRSLLSSKPSSSNKKTTSLSSALSTRKKPTKVSLGATSVGGDDGEDDFDAQFAKMTMETERKRKEEAAARAQRETDAISVRQETNKVRVKKQQQEADDRMDKYSSATSLSSDQFFQRGNYAETSSEDKVRLDKFHSANAIGSDAFFDREQSQNQGRGGSNDMDDVRDALGRKGAQIAGMASDFMGALKSRYNG